METQIVKCYWVWAFNNCLSSNARALFHKEHLAEMMLRDFEFAQNHAVWDPVSPSSARTGQDSFIDFGAV